MGLGHELDHAAAAALAGPFVPAWVHEGVAEWVAKARPTGERKPGGQESGPDPQRSNYNSFLSFNDPDGNGWLVQEVKRTPTAA